MVGFESVKKWRKMFFVLSRALEEQKFVWVPMRNRTSDLWIPRSDALPQRLYSERDPLRNSCMTSFSLSLPSPKLTIFLILLINMTLSTSLIQAVWMAVCHTWLMSCHVTLLTRRKAFFSEIKLFPKVSWQNHEKFSRVSLLLLSMENCRKSP